MGLLITEPGNLSPLVFWRVGFKAAASGRGVVVTARSGAIATIYYEHMARALVLACGNPLRGDDGVALEIARHLQQDAVPEREVVCAQQWTPELAETISGSDLVVFVDASASIPAGEIQCAAVGPGTEEPRVTTHSLSPASLLGLAHELYGKAPQRAFLLTIGGASFAHGERLSAVVRDAVPHACARILNLLETS